MNESGWRSTTCTHARTALCTNSRGTTNSACTVGISRELSTVLCGAVMVTDGVACIVTWWYVYSKSPTAGLNSSSCVMLTSWRMSLSGMRVMRGPAPSVMTVGFAVAKAAAAAAANTASERAAFIAMMMLMMMMPQYCSIEISQYCNIAISQMGWATLALVPLDDDLTAT